MSALLAEADAILTTKGDDVYEDLGESTACLGVARNEQRRLREVLAAAIGSKYPVGVA